MSFSSSHCEVVEVTPFLLLYWSHPDRFNPSLQAIERIVSCWITRWFWPIFLWLFCSTRPRSSRHPPCWFAILANLSSFNYTLYFSCLLWQLWTNYRSSKVEKIKKICNKLMAFNISFKKKTSLSPLMLFKSEFANKFEWQFSQHAGRVSICTQET